MKKYAFTFTGTRQFQDKISKHSFLLRCMPGTYSFQRTYAHKLTVQPYTALTYIHDAYGNEMYTGTIDKAHDTFSFTASGFVLSSRYLIHDPLDRMYLYPTAITQPTAQMRKLIETADLPKDCWGKAKALATLTGKLIKLVPGAPHTTAAEAFAAGQGTIDDFVHVYMTLCRLSGLGVRYVSGLALGISHRHAWAEVFCGNLWRGIDPWAGTEITQGYLKIAHGPDVSAAAVLRECCKESGTDCIAEDSVLVTEHVIRTRDTVPHA